MAILPMLLSLLLLCALASPGIAALDRFARFLTPLERFAYGAVLGIVAGTLAIVPAATLLGFSPPVVLGVAVASVVAAMLFAFGPGGRRRGGREEYAAKRAKILDEI